MVSISHGDHLHHLPQPLPAQVRSAASSRWTQLRGRRVRLSGRRDRSARSRRQPLHPRQLPGQTHRLQVVVRLRERPGIPAEALPCGRIVEQRADLVGEPRYVEKKSTSRPISSCLIVSCSCWRTSAWRVMRPCYCPPMKCSRHIADTHHTGAALSFGAAHHATLSALSTGSVLVSNSAACRLSSAMLSSGFSKAAPSLTSRWPCCASTSQAACAHSAGFFLP